MIYLSLKESRQVAKNRGIKGYKSISKDKLLILLNTPEPIKDNKPIKEIEKKILMLAKYLKT